MKPDTNEKKRLSPAQHLRLVQRMRSYRNCLTDAGIPPAATFRLAMHSGQRILSEIQRGNTSELDFNIHRAAL